MFVTFLTTILIFGLSSLYVYNKYAVAGPEIINSFKFRGKTFFILVPVAIIAQVLIHMIFAIINKMVTYEDIPTISDERDKLIELKAMRISHLTFAPGFLHSMCSQAISMEPWVMFITLVIPGIVSEAAKLEYYRIGV